MSVRVLLTRAAGRNDELARRLAELAGIEPVECPLIRIEAAAEAPIATAGYDWVVLTSRTGAELFFERATDTPVRVAVVGPGTAEVVRSHGVEPALVAQRSTQEGLLEELPRPAGRVLFAGAEDARPLLAQELEAEVAVLYRTVPETRELPVADLAVLASASAARSLAASQRPLPPCISIGPVTTETAREVGLQVIVEAATHDLDGLVDAVKLAASRAQSSPS